MVILDVREKEEYESEHIPGSILCPMSQLNTMAPGILKNLTSGEVIVMCRTGNRARLAIEELRKYDSRHSFTCYEGGILHWKQVQILASTMILLAFILSRTVHPDLIFIALLPGFGLGMAGWTGFCPAAKLLQYMPWNKASNSDTQKSCCR